jgi:elongation factor P--(R)-beta-lysine ligase
MLADRRPALTARAAIIRAIRCFFQNRDYLEVETPLLIPAPAPELHIDAIPAGSWFLHTSPELCMKQLLAAGYERIFQICRCWRQGERGRKHLPEFSMLEWYAAGCDYRDLMEECEELVREITKAVGKGNSITFRDQHISLAGPWERITVREAYLRHASISMEEALQRDLFDEVMVEDIEPHLGITRPTFIYDYPAERGALARLRSDDPDIAERFELYMGGLELANAFTELTDATEQRHRFADEENCRRQLGKQPYPSPEKFLDELAAMPQSAGIALGVDRLVMLLVDAASIDEVVAFTPEEL